MFITNQNVSKKSFKLQFVGQEKSHQMNDRTDAKVDQEQVKQLLAADMQKSFEL